MTKRSSEKEVQQELTLNRGTHAWYAEWCQKSEDEFYYAKNVKNCLKDYNVYFISDIWQEWLCNNLKSSIYNKQISKVVTGKTRFINWA